jgi:hypothetical protein
LKLFLPAPYYLILKSYFSVRFRPSSRDHVLIALRSPYWQRLMTVVRSLLRNTYLMGV